MDQRLDIDWVRAQFSLPPGFAFFDNAGGSFCLHRVVDRVAAYMREVPVQLGATHALSARAGALQHQALTQLGRLVGADARELVAGPSATALISRVARALASSLRAGDEIIVSEFDHESNISPWMRLDSAGVRVRIWPLNRDSGRAELDDLRALLGPRTRLVACTHCSNVLGDAVPLAEVVRLSHAAGAKVLADGVAWAPHRQVDVRALDVDYYVLSLYKVFGPHLGLLFGRRELLEGLDNINLLHLARDAVPYKLQPGGASYELVHGAAGITAYLAELAQRVSGQDQSLAPAYAAIAAHEAHLGRRLVERLASNPRVRWHGAVHAPDASRLPIYSFSVAGLSSQQIVSAVDTHRVGIRYGNFHAVRLMDALGLERADGVVRVSIAHYNTEAEVDRLADALERALR